MFPCEVSAPHPEKTRVLLVDDHPLVRERLSEIIGREADLVICGEAEDRHEALEMTANREPHLVIVDITLKASNGVELIKDIHCRWPHVLMLVVSMHDETLYAQRALRAGARGYITKQEATRNILKAIRQVMAGQIYVNERVASQILSQLVAKDGTLAETPSELLTDRELQVFELTGRGLNTRQIAARLHIGVKTVETYRTRIREKLDLRDSAELLPTAIRWSHGA